MQDPVYFELSFRPSMALVSVVRRFVVEFYQRFLDDPDGTSRVALATHELLENAVKYSLDGETTIRIDVATPAPGARVPVRIRLRNRAAAHHRAAIREILDGAAAASDRDAFYQAIIARSARVRTGSGLGLARIVAEGEMQVTCTELPDDVVVIEAATEAGRPT